MKFQINFSNIDQALRGSIIAGIRPVLGNNGWKLFDSAEKLAVSYQQFWLVFGGLNANIEWNPGRFGEFGEYMTYDYNDYNQWSKLKYNAFAPEQVRLNENYTAEVHKDIVLVGCQRISFAAVEALAAAVNKVKTAKS